MVRKAVIIVLTLAAIATALAWADSYWIRSVPLTPEQRSMISWFGHSQLPDPLDVSGRDVHHSWGDRKICTLATSRGALWLGYYSKIGPTAQLPRRAAGFGGFTYRSSAVRLFQPEPDGTLLYYRQCAVTVPLWFLFSVFAAYPTVAFIRGPVRRYRRRRKGLCVKCGYDLTGNVSGICPECGAEVKQP